MKLPLHIVFVLCAIAAGVGTLVRPGIPEVAIVLGVALGVYYWLQSIKRRERDPASDPNVVSC
jgi:hypothetical protein